MKSSAVTGGAWVVKFDCGAGPTPRPFRRVVDHLFDLGGAGRRIQIQNRRQDLLLEGRQERGAGVDVQQIMGRRAGQGFGNRFRLNLGGEVG